MTGDDMDKRLTNWNLNTLLSLVTLAGMVIGGVAIWVDKSRDIAEIQKWRADTELTGKERMVATEASRARTDERFQNQEKADSIFDKQIDNVVYRVTVLEQSMANTTKVVSDVQESLNDLKSDLKVVRTILERQDKKSASR